MPILDDLMDHDLLGPLIRRGREEGERLVISRQIARRFVPVPPWATQRVDALSADELERVDLRLLDARSLKELLD